MSNDPIYHDPIYQKMNPLYIDDEDALVWATHYDVEEEFLHCLNRGDCVNVKDEYGRTALHAAAEEGRIHYASVLIERGADVHSVDSEGDTALDYAIFHDHREIADLLRHHGAQKREGRSAKQKLDDLVYEGFEAVDAARRLFATIKEHKAKKARLDNRQ